MPGLIDQNQTAQAAAQPPPGAVPAQPADQPAAPPAEPTGANGEASSDEQETLDKIVTAAQSILYDKATSEPIMEVLKAKAADPSKAVVEVGAMIISQLDEASGGQLPVEYILPAADQILELIGELGAEAGLFEYGEREHSLALQEAISLIGDQYGLDEADTQAMMQSVAPEEQERARVQQAGYAESAQPAQAPQAPAQAPAAAPQEV